MFELFAHNTVDNFSYVFSYENYVGLLLRLVFILNIFQNDRIHLLVDILISGTAPVIQQLNDELF